MSRSVPVLIALLLGCTPSAPDPDPGTLGSESETILADTGQATPPPDAAPPPALGWVVVEGPVERSRLEVEARSPPVDPDQQLLVEAGDSLAAALCESPRDALRDKALQAVPPALRAAGYLGLAEPGTCHGPGFCAWALANVREGVEEPGLQQTLQARLAGCRGAAVDAWFAGLDPQWRAERALYDLQADKSLDLDTLDAILARMQRGESVHLAVLLTDARGRYPRDEVMERVLQAWTDTLDTDLRARIGRGLGGFADARSRRAWEQACSVDDAFTCEARGEAPLLPHEDLAERLVGIARRTGRYGLRPVLARARLDGLSDEALSEALSGCVEQADSGLTAEICLDALHDHDPTAVPALAERLLTSERPWWPLLRRRLRAARLGPQGTVDALVEAGLLDRSALPDPRRVSTDPVLLLVRAGRGAPVYEVDRPLGRVDLLRRLLALLHIDGSVELSADDPYRPVVWLDGERLTTTLNRGADADSVNANGLAAFANAIAAHRGLEQRLLVQPQYSRYVQSDVVVGRPEALQQAIDAGLLTAPTPDAKGWRRDRARWAAESLPSIDAE